MGTQPIKVLIPNILHWFQNIYPEFKDDLEKIIEQKGLKKGIKYINEESKIEHPAVVTTNQEIRVEESFLSYLWIICYCMLVIFDELVQKPQNSIPNPDKGRLLKNSRELFRYGISLLKRYSDWKKHLPNPEIYEKADEYYILKANSIFLNAFNFVICHELSHVSLGHNDNPFSGIQESKEVTLQLEIDADKGAIEIILKGIATEKTVRDRITGLIVGLCSLLFFTSDLNGNDHPDPDDRLTVALNSLNLPEDDYNWGIAAMGFQLWADEKGLSLTIPTEVETYKEWFSHINEEIKRIKFLT
jgi:hypothetical protein